MKDLLPFPEYTRSQREDRLTTKTKANNLLIVAVLMMRVIRSVITQTRTAARAGHVSLLTFVL